MKTSKIARIWETQSGFMVCDFDNERVCSMIFSNDADAGQWAEDNGFTEIFWM